MERCTFSCSVHQYLQYLHQCWVQVCSAGEVFLIGSLWDSSVSADRARFQTQREGTLVSILLSVTHSKRWIPRRTNPQPVPPDIQTYLSAPAGAFGECGDESGHLWLFELAKRQHLLTPSRILSHPQPLLGHFVVTQVPMVLRTVCGTSSWSKNKAVMKKIGFGWNFWFMWYRIKLPDH